MRNVDSTVVENYLFISINSIKFLFLKKHIILLQNEGAKKDDFCHWHVLYDYFNLSVLLSRDGLRPGFKEVRISNKESLKLTS
jgi:hypothetical protein